MKFIKDSSQDKNTLYLEGWLHGLYFKNSDNKIESIVFYSKDEEYTHKMYTHSFSKALKSLGVSGIQFDEDLSIKRKDKRDIAAYLMKTKDNQFSLSAKEYTLYLDMDKLNIKFIDIKEVSNYEQYTTILTLEICGNNFNFEVGSRPNHNKIKEHNLKDIQEYINTLDNLNKSVYNLKNKVESDELDNVYLSHYKLKEELDKIEKHLKNEK